MANKHIEEFNKSLLETLRLLEIEDRLLDRINQRRSEQFNDDESLQYKRY